MTGLLAGPSRPNSLLYDESPERMGGVSLNGGNGGGSNGGTNLFRDSITSASLLLEGVDPECVAWAHANSSGCRITLKDTAVNLTIPEGALNKTEELFCALLTEDKDRPQLRGKSNTCCFLWYILCILLGNAAYPVGKVLDVYICENYCLMSLFYACSWELCR